MSHDLYAYRIDLCYDGRLYSGFQSQPSQCTIQDIVEAALTKVAYLHGRLIGASRTDAGVSAYQQVCLFRTTKQLQEAGVVRSLNRILPAQIRVQQLEIAPQNFHPLASSRAKIYRYRLYCGTYPAPIGEEWFWRIPRQLDLGRLARELDQLIGVHDFRAFTKYPLGDRTTMRRILDIQVFSHHAVVELWFHGEGFLRHMIRNIVGSAVVIASTDHTQLGLRHLRDILVTYDRTQAYQTAPAVPLCLMACLFDQDPRLIRDLKAQSSVDLDDRWRF